MEFNEKYNLWLDVINDKLQKYVVEKDVPQQSIYTAMKYSLMAGGKRLRPILSLAVCEMLHGDINTVIPFACAIEMIHTYSLIHDDLPAMDNDDYRRGRLTNHKVFGEAKAILAGDALLNYAFEIMLEACMQDHYSSVEEKTNIGVLPVQNKIKAMKIIADASGVSGMIGGQIVDLESENKQISADMLHYMHKYKTGALIKAPILSAAALCGANEEQIKYLEEYAENIGLGFQIKDDILDIEGNFETLGKAVGSDVANQKSTFVTIYGLDESKKMLVDITNKSINVLRKFGDEAQFLVNLSNYLLTREK